jgi:hypothetical protein
MVVASLPTQRIDLTPAQVVAIDGTPYRALAVETQHGVDRPIGTATITLAPVGASVTDLRASWLNRPIEAQIGYVENGGAARVFVGRIASISRAFDRNGSTLQVRANGYAELLDFPSEEDIVFAGNSRLYDIVRSLCQMRGLPMYGGDLITYPTSTTPVRLGGVSFVDEGKIIIPKRTSPLRWIVQKLQLFGYRAYDQPDGQFHWQRVNGIPPGSAVETFEQGVNLFSLSRDDEVAGMVTWWDVEGASWTDDDGIAVKIRSFPSSVPPDSGGYVTPPGYVRDAITDDALVTQALANAVRNAHEIDTGGPSQTGRWRYTGDTKIQPGDTVALTSPLMELSNAKRWVLSVDHSSSTKGIRTTWTGWTGAGNALAAGDDSTTIRVFTDPRHIGDEYVGWYAVPSPNGRVIQFDITVPDTYTAIILSGWVHGSNSYFLEGASSESEVSKIEVWQFGGDKAIGTGTLPTAPENYEKRLTYDPTKSATLEDGSVKNPIGYDYWQRFRIPVPGRLEPGIATVKLISGEDRRISDQFRWDDFEIAELDVTLTGSGSPDLPGSGS